MQVRHESRLLEPSPISPASADGASGNNQSLDSYYLAPLRSNSLCPIERLACGNPSGSLLAAHLSQTNQVVLFDARSHQRRDRFPLKACDKKYSRQSFQVSAMDFSRDGQRLAVGQTDCIIYIYKLAQNSSAVGKPPAAGNQQPAPDSAGAVKPTTISGKFAAASPISCLIWSDLGILFGSQDGRVRVILSSGSQPRSSHSGMPMQNGLSSASDLQPPQSQASNTAPRVVQLHQSSSIGSIPIVLALKPPLLLIGQLDCKVQLLLLAGEPAASLQDSSLDSGPSSRRNSSVSVAPSVRQTLAINHSCPPIHVSCLPNNTICFAGSDGRVAFHSVQLAANSLTSAPLQVIDVKEDIQGADLSPINEILALITRRRLMFIKWEQESSSWRLQPALIEFKSLFGLASVRWLRDGTQLALGHSNSALDLFRCSWQKQAINEQLDICHIARNRIRITDRERNLLATFKTQHDIKRVNILDQNQSVLIWTSSSLLLARLNCQLHSELSWPLVGSSGSKQSQRNQAKFLFESSGFVLIYLEATSECHLVRLGENQVRFSVKLAQIKRAQLSIRQFPPINELYSSSQANSSPSELRPNSVSYSAQRSDSAHSQSQRNSLAAELPAEDSLQMASENNSAKSAHHESQSERFAFTSGERHTQLNIVDLKLRPAKLSHVRQFDGSISQLKFSCTSNFLIVIEGEQQNRFHLLKISSSSSQSEPTSTLESVATFESCHFADWLPETDSLVIQLKSQVQIWFDLSELKPSLRLDCRSFNYAKRTPLLDLSAQQNETETYPKCQQIVCQSYNQTDFLRLSNDQEVPIDRVGRRFYAELTLGKLESALELLQKQPSDQQKSWLFAKLGWKAIERADCQLAIRIFSRINHSKLVAFLVKCESLASSLEQTEQSASVEGMESAMENQKRDESGLMLAKLRGDWRKFEELALEQDLILATYKRLNKWILCLDYLERAQQFRQRDIAQAERQQWLISRGRCKEAAHLRVKQSGDLIGAIELLVERKQFIDAADLLLAEQKVPLDDTQQLASTQTERRMHEFAGSIVQQLVTSGDHFRAGQMNERILDKKQEALELYLEGGEFALALALAERMQDLDEARLKRIHFDYARHLEKEAKHRLVSKKRGRLAVKHFLEAGSELEALELAAELKLDQEAGEILSKHQSSLLEMKQQSNQLGDLLARFDGLARSFSSHGTETSRRVASELFELAEAYESLVELLVECGELNRAFKVALGKKNGNDTQRTESQFRELANQLASGQQDDELKLQRAEQIYLMIGQPELAIEMYRKLGMHEQMLELIERHQPEQLEASLLQLARSFESAGQLEEAERLLLRASSAEWTGVVRMYRLAQRWPDAFRVARANCLSSEDPLLVQLAYWWAKSLVAPSMEPAAQQEQRQETRKSREEILESASKLLSELQLKPQVVEFCCETKNYRFAIDLLEGETSLRRDVVLRYAAHLERQHKFAEAERVLLDNRLVELAARMYLDNELHQEAVRVIEQQLESAQGEEERAQLNELLNKALIESARQLASSATSSFRRTPPIMRQQQALDTPVSSSSPSGRATSSANLQLAQQMFLRAQRPELAIEMYQSLGLWQEAIQVAQRFAPRLLEQVEQALDAQVSDHIEPILRSTRSGSRDDNSDRVADATSEELARSANGQAEQVVEEKEAAPSARPLDALWLQLRDQLNKTDRRAARSTLAKFLSSLSNVELDHELAGHLSQLAKSVGDSNSWLAATMSQEENVANLSRLADAIFLQADWRSSIWPSLASLLLSCHLSSRSIGERNAGLQRRCLIALHVTTLGALEDFLQDSLSGTREDGTNRVQSHTGGATVRRSGPLFGRKTARRTAHQNVVAAESPQAERAPSWLTVKQVESLMQSANWTKLEPLMELLAKLSLGLMRHADQLDACRLLLAAGRWQLALGRAKVARDLWASLVELLDQLGGSQRAQVLHPLPSSLRSNLGKFLDLPDSLALSTQSHGRRQVCDQQELAQIRHWLLESLIGGSQSAANSSGADPLPVCSKLGALPVCALCGQPAEASSRVAHSNGAIALRRAEFVLVCELAGLRVESKQLSESAKLAQLFRDNKQTCSSEASARLRVALELALKLATHSGDLSKLN